MILLVYSQRFIGQASIKRRFWVGGSENLSEGVLPPPYKAHLILCGEAAGIRQRIWRSLVQRLLGSVREWLHLLNTHHFYIDAPLDMSYQQDAL
jgi:hypothetical protein